MPDLLTASSHPVSVANGVGERVLIVRGPLQGMSGLIAEVNGDEALVDLRGTISGMLVRCPVCQLAPA
jgi:transcription antitermination factor NusG